MKKILLSVIFMLFLSSIIYSQKAPHINVYPPQIHQQICQESTFTRYLDIFNTGDTILTYNAAFSPETPGWAVTSGALSGQVLTGDTTTIQFDFNSAGLPLDNYYADFIINSNDPVDTNKVVLTMLHVQVLTILVQPEQDSICLGCSTQLTTHVYGCSEAYSFSWVSDPAGYTSIEKSPVVNPQVTTTYTVTVTDGNYSDQKSVLIKVTPSNGITETSLFEDVSVFPNPCDKAFVLKFDSEMNGQGEVSLYNPLGSLLLKSNFFSKRGVNEMTINTGDIKPGLYILSFRLSDKSDSSSLILKKIFIY